DERSGCCLKIIKLLRWIFFASAVKDSCHKTFPHQKEMARFISESGHYLSRQLPTLPQPLRCSTIGPAGLNFRVRDGNGWNPRGKITDLVSRLLRAIPSGSRPSSPWMTDART